MSERWRDSDVPRGAAYDRRFETLADAGVDVHGEADLVDSYGPTSVLDAGCGTGRLAIELGRRGRIVAGVDIDEAMLEAARAKAPDQTWVQGDLADPTLGFGRAFDVVVMAGNVLIFVAPGTEGQVLANAARSAGAGGSPRRRLHRPPRRAGAGRARRLGGPGRAGVRGALGDLGPAALRARRRVRRGRAPSRGLIRPPSAPDATEHQLSAVTMH